MLFRSACAASAAPVLITDGPARPDFDAFLDMVAQALTAGAMGTCLGRMIWRQDDPGEALKRFLKIAHETPGPKRDGDAAPGPEKSPDPPSE